MGKRVAFIVGINDYGDNSRITSLKYAEADAKLMDKTLRELFEFTTTVILGEQANHVEITRALRTFYNEEDIDLFLFYFSGHGELIREVGMHCLYCYGSEYGDTLGTLNLMEWANRIKRNIHASQILLVVDACRDKIHRGVDFRGETVGLHASVRTDLSQISNEPSSFWGNTFEEEEKPKLLFTLLSCGVGQVSYEDDELKQGIFTYALVKELKKHGKTLPFSQLRKKVGDYTYKQCISKNLYPQMPEWIEPSLTGEVFLVEINEGNKKINLPDLDRHLGKAISDVFVADPSPYGTQGYVRRYEKGSIYFVFKAGHPRIDWAKLKNGTSIHLLDLSPIGVRYESMGGSGSILGFPAFEVKDAWNSQRKDWKSSGLVQFFEGGSIFFCERYGAHSLVMGDIWKHFRESELNAHREEGEKLTGGQFGFPICDQEEVSSITNAVGTVQRFEFGLIFAWSAGVFSVVKGFYNLYQSKGEWKSDLGFPLSDEEPIESLTEVEAIIQFFEQGCMLWSRQTDECRYIVGEIYLKWKDNKDEYGFPLNNPSRLENKIEQIFENDKICIECLDDTKTKSRDGILSIIKS
jgi:hypothetical protein